MSDLVARTEKGFSKQEVLNQSVIQEGSTLDLYFQQQNALLNVASLQLLFQYNGPVKTAAENGAAPADPMDLFILKQISLNNNSILPFQRLPGCQLINSFYKYTIDDPNRKHQMTARADTGVTSASLYVNEVTLVH